MKLENIMFDENYNLKLVDFGLSTLQGNAPNYKYCGSEGYQPPEILMRKKYIPQDMDLFAAGIILYQMSVGYAPFTEAKL